jgi:hypothetical protein
LNKAFGKAVDRVRRGENLNDEERSIHKFSKKFAELSPGTTFTDRDLKGFQSLSGIMKDYKVTQLMDWIRRARVFIQYYNDAPAKKSKTSKKSKKSKKSKTTGVLEHILLPREEDIVSDFMRYVWKLKFASKCPPGKKVPQACFKFIKAAVARWNRKPENRHAYIPIPERWGDTLLD